MRTYDPTEPVAYLHIPRCAGSSLVFLLARWFNQGYLRLQSEEANFQSQRDRIATFWPKIQCLHAYFNHDQGCGLPYSFPEIRQYVTILRDPFDAVVSMYFSAKEQSRNTQSGPNRPLRALASCFPSVTDFVQQYPAWLYEHLPCDLDLANYQQKLTERFLYIGIFEDLQESIRQLALVLQKPLYPVPRLNAAIYDEPIPESLRKQFYGDYPLLKRVYDFAVKRYRLTSA